MQECIHYNKTCGICSFRMCRYPEERFVCPLKNPGKLTMEHIANRIDAIVNIVDDFDKLHEIRILNQELKIQMEK